MVCFQAWHDTGGEEVKDMRNTPDDRDSEGAGRSQWETPTLTAVGSLASVMQGMTGSFDDAKGGKTPMAPK
jgi:hypothetical protein